MKVETWDDSKAKSELVRRFKEASDFRKRFEDTWRSNESTLYKIKWETTGQAISTGSDGSYSVQTDSPDEVSDVNINYVIRDIRMIHSQMSANPPVTAAKPLTPDYSDRKAAEAADRLMRFATRQYDFPERFDKANLNSLIYGIDYIKGIHNPEKGEIIDFDEETNEVVLEGDYELSVPSVWDMFPDPHASVWEDVTYVFQCFNMSLDKAMRMFPTKEKILKAQKPSENTREEDNDEYHEVRKKPNTVKVYQYWEKGLPENGMIGRFCWCTEDGTLLSDLVKNPHAFSRTVKGKKLPAIARLPFHVKTDIDIPDTYFGHSIIAFSSPVQEAINQIDNVTLDTAKIHGLPRLILPDGCEIKDDSITNTPMDIIKTTGNRDPHFAEPAPMPPLMSSLRNIYNDGIMQMHGTNESLFGQQQREQSGFMMQYATQQSNMNRKRYFNKYVKQVESVYKDFLDIVREKWDTPRTIKIMGKEKAFTVAEYQGSDIAGGYDVGVEYGTTLSLDPIMRRDEILKLMPVFEKAGISMRNILSMLRLNEVERAYDVVQMAEDRQREIFEEMEVSRVYIAPEELQDHANYLDWAYQFRNSAEFKYKEPWLKQLIIRHIKEREEMAGKDAKGEIEDQNTAPAVGEAAPQMPGNLMSLLGG